MHDAHLHRIAVLHGAGYAGGELIRLLLGHPAVSLDGVTSRSFAGQPVWHAHPTLRNQIDLSFTAPGDLNPTNLDALFIAAEHGKGVEAVQNLLADGFAGVIVDLSADLRFHDASLYDTWFGYTHPAPDLLDDFVYGLAEVNAPYPVGTKWIANPGCFASGIGLALWPVAQHLPAMHASVTALTGASGSGTRAKSTTHYPTRDGNVRAYKILAHQHLPEIQQTLGDAATVAFVPVSGPWTRGIWGTAHVTLPGGVTSQDVGSWFEEAYADGACVRLWPDQLPELRYAVGTPFCDIGWVVEGDQLIVGFALDNLLKGAASQAVQNMNLALGLPETAGLALHSELVLHP
ncbi:MAG TPA: N-acetyl-gamma-glutamyl-phosphate reductase [Rhodothermales bacterium]|nr:N-acetyl-gamma-glutamyl-phosphate reductase [Rhodothermales bacterium]